MTTIKPIKKFQQNSGMKNLNALPAMKDKESKMTYHHQGFSLYFRIACIKLESWVVLRIEPYSLGNEDLVVHFDMQV
jgi:hypothetical protein